MPQFDLRKRGAVASSIIGGYIADFISHTYDNSDVAATYATRYLTQALAGYIGDKLLLATADVLLSSLIDLKSPGCEWLSICD